MVRYPAGSPANVAAITVEAQTTYQHEREFRTFVDELVGRSWKESLNYVRRIRLSSCDILLCILNYSTIAATEWTEYGFVGSSGWDAIASLRKESIERRTFKFIALHHHVLPVAEVEAPRSKGVSLTLDASRLLEDAQVAGVHVVLHGHQHFPKIAKYQTISFGQPRETKPLCVVSNGSTGGRRLPTGERNTYCVFKIDGDDILVWMRELKPSGREGPTLFRDHLGLEAELPPSSS